MKIAPDTLCRCGCCYAKHTPIGCGCPGYPAGGGCNDEAFTLPKTDQPTPVLHQADMTITLSTPANQPAPTDAQLLAVLTRRVTRHLRSLLVIRHHPDPPHLPLAHYVITPPDTEQARVASTKTEDGTVMPDPIESYPEEERPRVQLVRDLLGLMRQGAQEDDERIGWTIYETNAAFHYLVTVLTTAPHPHAADVNHPIFSNVSSGTPLRRLTWRELAERNEARAQQAEHLASILSDLNRCEHGRHEGDYCAGAPPSGCGGVSRGNPIPELAAVSGDGGERFGPLTLERQLGFTIGRRPICVPERGRAHEPEAWHG